MVNTIKLIGVDVDGTLLNSVGQIPPENLQAIQDAVAAGIHVAIVTGRSYPSARPIVARLPETISLIVSNGAVERGMDGSTIARRLLNRRVARGILEGTRSFRSSAALIFDRDLEKQVIFETMNWEHPARKGYWGRNQTLIAQSIPLEDALIEDPIQVMFNGGVAEMQPLYESLRDLKGVTVSLTEYKHRDFSLVDVTALEATKGNALAWRAKQLGLTRDEVMAVGDNFNDTEMLEFAGTPVVMGNAVAGLKDRGWHLTEDHNEGGLAKAIARFALKR